jgi:esterase/lipase
MDYTLIEDLEKNKDRLDIKKAVSKISIPYLIIHGEEDLAVDYSEALELHSLSNKNLTELCLIEKAGHTFGAVHPFEGTTKALEEVINLIIKNINDKINI